MIKTKEKVQVPESIVNDEPRTLDEASFPIGSVACQGDLYFVRIHRLPKSAKPSERRQLADGNTQGSRHVVSRGNVYACPPVDVVKAIQAACPKVAVDARYIGPVFETLEGECDVVHPEHGDHLFRGRMVLATVFQRNLDSEEREQRTLD